MTIDDLIRLLHPLSPSAVGELLGYAQPGNQVTTLRARGSAIPPDRLRRLAVGLREEADRLRSRSSNLRKIAGKVEGIADTGPTATRRGS
jgi:hypothetical protein